jgi:antitoxin HigA-1
LHLCTPAKSRKEFLISLGMSGDALAKVCGVPRTRIERLANEESGVTADTALRLSRLSAPLPHCGLTCRTIRYSYTARRVIGKDLDKITPVIERST